jgi:hypothetical protein
MKKISPHGDWQGEPDPVDVDLALRASLLRKEDEAMFRDAMRQWFLSHYADPAKVTPLSENGDYIWTSGGPFEPKAVLVGRFGDLADLAMIEDLAEEFFLEVGSQWARKLRDDDYDQRFEVEIEDPDAPLLRLKDRMAKSCRALHLQGDASAMQLLPHLVYGSLISSFEAFLFETVTYWVENDEHVLKGIVTRLPALKDQPLKLGEIFREYDALNIRVKGYLQSLVWHQWDKVAQLFTYGFGFRPPSFKPFNDALLKRHDIVHRSGHDKDGNPVDITAADVSALAGAIEMFAQNVHALTLLRVFEDGEMPAPEKTR